MQAIHNFTILAGVMIACGGCGGQQGSQIVKRANVASDAPARVGEAVTIATDALQPQIVVDGKGIYVVFIQKGNIAVSVSRDGGKSFAKPVVAIDVGGRARGGAHRGPRIGVDAHGCLTVTAPVTFDESEYKGRYPTAELYFVRSTDGGQTWSKPVQVNEVPKKAPEALHWMVVAPNGEVHVAWLDRRSRQRSGQDLYYATIVDGKVGTNHKVATTVCECCAPGTAVDGNGNPLLVYREGGIKESREIFARRSTDGGRSFEEPFQVNQAKTLESGCPMSAPAIAVSEDGKRFAVAWKDMREREPNIFWSVSDKLQSSRESLLHENKGGVQDHPSLAVDSNGVVWAAWDDDRDGSRRVCVRSSKAMDLGRVISDQRESPASYPVVATGGGLVAVVYESGKTDHKRVHFRLIERY